jgi:hypothetical protein
VTGTIQQLFTMREALTDPALMGNVMSGPSWLPHRTLAIAAMGEELSAEERIVFERFTGRSREPGQRVKEFCTIGGRGSGKTVHNGVMATYLSSCVDYRGKLRKGEPGVYLCLAQTQQVAKQLLEFVETNLLGSEILKQRFVRRTAELVELTNNIRVEVRSASGRKLRGPRFIGITADELAHWQTEEYLQDPDVAILNGARPGMLTVRSAGWGMVTMASSPHIRRGELWNMFNKHYGKDDLDYLVARGTTREFNPTIPQEEVDRELARDYETNKAEYLAEFRNDLEEYVSRAAVEKCIAHGVHERPWVYGTTYFAFIDPATGSGSDSFTLAICHVKNGNTIVIDLLREWRPQSGFKVHEVVSEICNICKSYCTIRKIVSDHTGKWLESHFSYQGGMMLECSAKPKHDLYLNLLPYVNSARIELFDEGSSCGKRCLMQLLALERSKAKIDHPSGQNDDLINSVAGVADIAISGKYGGYLTDYSLWAD